MEEVQMYFSDVKRKCPYDCLHINILELFGENRLLLYFVVCSVYSINLNCNFWVVTLLYSVSALFIDRHGVISQTIRIFILCMETKIYGRFGSVKQYNSEFRFSAHLWEQCDIIIIIIIIIITTTTTTATGLSPGGSSPTLVQTQIKITQNNKITIKQQNNYKTTKYLQNEITTKQENNAK